MTASTVKLEFKNTFSCMYCFSLILRLTFQIVLIISTFFPAGVWGMVSYKINICKNASPNQLQVSVIALIYLLTFLTWQTYKYHERALVFNEKNMHRCALPNASM